MFTLIFDLFVHGFNQQIVTELDTVVGQDFYDLERILRQRLPQKFGGGFYTLVVVQFQIDVARGPIDSDESVRFHH